MKDGAAMMSHDDAEEFTQSLGQIVGGSWRQIALADRLGVPKALGLSLEAWVKQRLGGYIRLAVDDRRQAVIELSAEGHSQRQIASVLGVDQKTISNDLSEENSSHAPTNYLRTDQKRRPIEENSSDDMTNRNSVLAVARSRNEAIDRERAERPQRFAADEIYDSFAYTLAMCDQWLANLTPHERGRQRPDEWMALLHRLEMVITRLQRWQKEDDQCRTR
jgi:predicted transcriptional regulator